MATKKHVILFLAANPSGTDHLALDREARSIRAELKRAGASVKLVVLNACFTAPIAEALLAHIDCVVGMSGAIHDDAARSLRAGSTAVWASARPSRRRLHKARRRSTLDGREPTDRDDVVALKPGPKPGSCAPRPAVGAPAKARARQLPICA